MEDSIIHMPKHPGLTQRQYEEDRHIMAIAVALALGALVIGVVALIVGMVILH